MNGYTTGRQTDEKKKKKNVRTDRIETGNPYLNCTTIKVDTEHRLYTHSHTTTGNKTDVETERSETHKKSKKLRMGRV